MKKFAAILIFSAALVAFGQSPQTTPLMPLDAVRPGMKGVGRTVFEGTAIQEFQAEIMGVLRNVEPNHDLILARLSGGPLERTGVIQGMSGSPVYIDGRLVGAVAYAFPFSKDPIAGIQPIGQMIDVLGQRSAPARAGVSPESVVPEQTPAAFVFGMLEKVRLGTPLEEVLSHPFSPLPGAANALTRIQTPLNVSGATPAVLRQFSSYFSARGFGFVQSGGTGGSGNLPSVPPKRLEPGAAVNAELVRGDLDISANGTVTHVDGDKVYAFGHPFLSAGPMSLPMSTAYIVTSMARLDTSAKVAVPVDVVGAFRQDRSTGILGSMADKPSMIPLTIAVKASDNSAISYRFEVVNDRYLTPLLTSLTVINAISASERSLGEMTLSVTGKVNLKNSLPVNISNISTGDGSGATLASAAAVAPIQYLLASGFDGDLIENINLEIIAIDRKTSATLERISINRNEVRPGDTVILSAHIRGVRGETITETYPVMIPPGLSSGKIEIAVGDGGSVTASELRRGATGAPPGLAAAVRELNRLRRNDRLYVKIVNNEPGVVISGEQYPSLPPSMIALLDTDRASSRKVVPMTSSTVVEYELAPSKYVLQGFRSLTVTVKP